MREGVSYRGRMTGSVEHRAGGPTPGDRAPGWLAELPLTPGPPWVTMGVRGIDDEAWLVTDDDFARQIEHKAVLTAAGEDVFRAEPGTEPAGEETLALVSAWVAAHGSSAARAALAASEADGRARAADGVATPASPAGGHPLLRAALLVQEDLCVMAERDGASCLVAGAVHFPSHWRLGEKMGLPMARIHGPVRHYAAELERRADRFFARLAPGRIVVRRNVSVHDHDDLFRPEPPETYEDFDGDFGRLWLRSERQTLRRLPTSGAILFTIKTQQCPLPLVRLDRSVAAGLAARLRAIRIDHEADGVAAHAPSGVAEWLEAAPTG